MIEFGNRTKSNSQTKEKKVKMVLKINNKFLEARVTSVYRLYPVMTIVAST